jgi:hypothetical protein
MEINLPKTMLQQGQNSLPFNLSQLAPGLYYVVMVFPEEIQSIKFVKE